MNNHENETPKHDQSDADAPNYMADEHEIPQPANPMSQLAQMYRMIEAHLRREALTVPELRHKPDIAAMERNAWQVKGILNTMMRHEVLDTTGAGKLKHYTWKKNAPPFVLPLKVEQSANRAPSLTRVMRPEQPRHKGKGLHAPLEPLVPVQQPIQQPVSDVQNIGAVTGERRKQKPLEIIANGLIILVDQNPESGNDRITIERIWDRR